MAVLLSCKNWYSLAFKSNVGGFCKQAGQKLHALPWPADHMTVEKGSNLKKYWFNSLWFEWSTVAI